MKHTKKNGAAYTLRPPACEPLRAKRNRYLSTRTSTTAVPKAVSPISSAATCERSRSLPPTYGARSLTLTNLDLASVQQSAVALYAGLELW
jgi:hypothetical protein